jgi:hypothetical protein
LTAPVIGIITIIIKELCTGSHQSQHRLESEPHSGRLVQSDIRDLSIAVPSSIVWSDTIDVRRCDYVYKANVGLCNALADSGGG